MKPRFCERCGKEIEAGHPEAKYCNSCRAAVHMEVWDSVRAEREQIQAENREKEKREKAEREAKRYKGPSIAQLNAAAARKGLSYGHYVAKYGSVIV